MGVNSHVAELWSKIVSEHDILNGGSMVEFGNQHFFLDVVGKKSPLDVYYTDEHARKVFKNWVNLLGISHVSIDINGEDGALPFDLSNDLSHNYLLTNKFDMGTNFGTLEHIDRQYWAWGNMHNFIKVDGIALHALPKVGSWEGHPSCYWRYTFEFVERLCEVCNYELLDLHEWMNELTPDLLVYAIIKKVREVPFISTKILDDVLTYAVYSQDG